MVMSAGWMRSASLMPMTTESLKTRLLTESAEGPLPRMTIVSVSYIDPVSLARLEIAAVVLLVIQKNLTVVFHGELKARQQVP